MWDAFAPLDANKIPALRRGHFYSPWTPLPAVARRVVHDHLKVSRQSRRHSGSADNPVTVNAVHSMSDPFAAVYDVCPRDRGHWDEIFSVSSLFCTYDPPLWSPLLLPEARRQAFLKFGGHCINCGQRQHNMRKCLARYILRCGAFNAELAALHGGGDAFCQRQQHLRSHRRDHTIKTPPAHASQHRSHGHEHHDNR